MRLWDVATGTERRLVCESLYEIGCLATSPISGQVFVGEGASIRLYDAATGREVQRYVGHTEPSNAWPSVVTAANC